MAVVAGHRRRECRLRGGSRIRDEHARLAACRAQLDLHRPVGRKKIGLIGYSGGAIATEWAAELAPSYAPEIDRRIVGAAFGGALVDPAHNLHYVDGSRVWSGVMPMAIIGVSRAFHVDLTPYLSDYGMQLFNNLQHAIIARCLALTRA